MSTPTPEGPGTGIDWAALGRSGSRAVGRPSLVILIIGAVMVAGLFATTFAFSGVGAWLLRIAAIVLAVPVVMLAVRRRQVLSRLDELERTGEHPDNVVRTTTPDGQQLEVIVQGAERTLVPRLGVGGLAGYAIATVISTGLSFGLLLITGLASLL